MRELSLFTGAGGGLLGSHLLGWTPIGYVEWNSYCQQVIAARIRDGFLPTAPIFGDIRAFISEGYAEAYQGMVDVITGGFSCQPFSSASRGRRVAIDVWPEMRTVIRIVKPKYVFAENVSESAISVAADDLERIGYKTRYTNLSAADLGADHIRRRYWLLAYANHESELLSTINAKVASVPQFCTSIWATYPDESGMADGVGNRMERFKAIGNAQIPIVAATAWRILSGNIN